MSLDGFSLAPLVKMLNISLSGGRIKKIFQPDKNTLLFHIRQPGITYHLLLTAKPDNPYLCLTDKLPANPAAASAFCMLLRKHLKDGRISKIIQNNLDRVVFLKIDVRDEQGLIITKCLTFELMGKHSNLILTEENKILDAIKHVGQQLSRYRTVLPHREYFLPPGKPKLNILSSSPADLIISLKKISLGQLSKAIINSFDGVGPITAKEVIYQAGLPADIKIEQLDNADYDAISDSLQTIINSVKSDTLIIMPTVIFSPDNKGLGIAAFPIRHILNGQTKSFATMCQAVEYFDSLKGGYRIPGKDLLLKFITTELNKLQRKAAAISLNLKEADERDKFRHWADLLMTQLHSIPSGTSQAVLIDFFAENNQEILIMLDPMLTPLKNAQNYYDKFNKQKRAKATLDVHLNICLNEVKYLESINVALELSETRDAITEIREELVTAGYFKATKKRVVIKALPYKVMTNDGTCIFIGKNNKQNDQLTFNQSHPDDVWLHTKDIPGSHVLLRTGALTPTLASIETAALLAAYFSKARNSSNVPVDYTKRRYVKKPAGTKPGFVTYENQTTIYVTPDAQIVAEIMAAKKII